MSDDLILPELPPVIFDALAMGEDGRAPLIATENGKIVLREAIEAWVAEGGIMLEAIEDAVERLSCVDTSGFGVSWLIPGVAGWMRTPHWSGWCYANPARAEYWQQRFREQDLIDGHHVYHWGDRSPAYLALVEELRASGDYIEDENLRRLQLQPGSAESLIEYERPEPLEIVVQG